MTPDLYIAIPSRDGMLPAECVRGLLSCWGAWPCTWDDTRGGVAPHNRDQMSAAFLQGVCTHLLCVDSDIAWNRHDVERLLELDVDFAFGDYQTKSRPGRMLASGYLGSTLVKESTALSPAGFEVVEYMRAPAGFMLLRRVVIERLWERAVAMDEIYVDGGGRSLAALWQTPGFVERVRPSGEVVLEQETDDFAFCRRWRSIGGRIFTRPDVVLGHIGPYTYRPEEKR